MKPESGHSSRYQVLGRIASGGMATVYVARLHGAGTFSRLVAVKKPHSFVTKNPRMRQQLQHEARVASMIHHPNVVAVLDVDESDGELALVMDYVDGCTLKELVEHAENAGERIPRAVVRILLDVAAGLHAAHSLRDANGTLLGVVHRDVSPHNVLVGRDGIARLADFGIAKIASLQSEITATDAIAGKLAYAAPEYLSTKRCDALSDLFSLGVVAWESLTQARLFQGATPVETMLKVLDARAPALDSTRPELAPLAPPVAQALSRNAIDRQASVQAFAQALEAAARDRDGVASHAEVAELVERLAKDELAARRRELAGFDGGVAAQSGLTGAARSARDEIATQTLLPLASQAWQTTTRAEARRSLGPYGIGALLLLGFGAFLFLRSPSTVVESRPQAQTTLLDVPKMQEPTAPASTPAPAQSAAVAASAGSQSRPKRVLREKPAAAAQSTIPVHAPAPSALLFPKQAPPNPYAATTN